VAVIFRRGPSKWTEVIRWDTSRDRFERGAWFHGRIYDEHSDLSPDGELLIYFASQFTRRGTRQDGYTDTWTAISRPPWLTALALWPKGDTYAGGGLFLGKRQVWLYHWPEEAKPHPRHQPKGLRITSPDARTKGESLYMKRLARDGWQIDMRQHEIRRRWRDGALCAVARATVGSVGFAVEGPSGPVPLPPGRIDWLDWDANGRLFALVDGTIQIADVTEDRVGAWRMLLDTRDDKPETRRSPESARVW
jgi:hypothetical protein